MNKKDRIAVVVSIFMLSIAVIKVTDGGGQTGGLLLMLIFSYWSYRFIKNDISFLKVKDE